MLSKRFQENKKQGLATRVLFTLRTVSAVLEHFLDLIMLLLVFIGVVVGYYFIFKVNETFAGLDVVHIRRFDYDLYEMASDFVDRDTAGPEASNVLQKFLQLPRNGVEQM